MSPIDLLGKIIEISHSNLETTSRISAILDIMVYEMHFDEAIVFTYDKDKRLTCRQANRQSILFNVLSKYRCHIGEGVVGSTAQKRMPQFFSKRDVPPRFGCLFYPDLDEPIEKYKMFSFYPLTDDSYLYGVLVMCSSKTDTMHDRDKILLSIISREIGGILRTNELLISSKKRISELATLSELGKTLTSNMEPQTLLKGIVLIVARALDAAFVSIKIDPTLWRLNGQRFTYGTIDSETENQINGIEKGAAKQKKMVCIKSSDLAQTVPQEFSIYSTPIISKNLTIGTITICKSGASINPALEENGQYLISTIANYITSGLENTLLNSRLRDLIRELHEAQKRIIEQETLRSLGEMTANIAHEIKNPLVIIGGFTKRLAKKLDLDQAENKYVSIIIKEVARLEAILNEILDYVKEGPAPREECNINDCIDEILYLFSSDTSWEGVQIIKKYKKDLPPISCDTQQVKQVFINIIMNAYEAMDGKGKITITTEETSLREGRFIAVSIEDTGGGIDPAVIDNIFNPFFTTKEKGTGLGLAISNKIIINHSGKIEINNMLGRGAVFFVYLPLKNNIIKKELI